MTEEKRTSAKIHVFSGERPQRAEENTKERAVRRRRTAEQPDQVRPVQKSGIKTVQNEQNTDRYADAGKQQKGQAAKAGRPSRYTDTAPVRPANPAAKRYREQENDRKMKLLKRILAVLVAVLITALVYEVILGHGTKQTGAQRMAQQEQQKQQMLQESETAEMESESSEA